MKGFNIYCFLIFITLVIPLLLQGQTDTLYIEPIEITAQKIRTQPIGGQEKHWTATGLDNGASNIAELLEREGMVFIKSYGLNSLATSSIRGGSAGHTLVLWNGLPIQSPMLGLLDLSLLPLQSVEEVTLHKGGSSALWGSGAISGVIGLNNQPDFSNQLSLGLRSEAGSFGEWSQNVQISFGNSHFQSTSKISHHRANNDFYYFVAEGFPDRQQTNAHFSQQNFFQDFYWNFKKNQKIAAHFWLQYSDREIPPTNTQTRSQARQKDWSNRFTLDWQQVGKHAIFQAKAGFFDEKMEYFDEAIGLESPSEFSTLFGELDGQWSWKNQHKIYIGATQSYTKAKSSGYQNPPKEFKSALFASYLINRSKWQLQASLRQEFIDGTFAPLVPVLGFNYQLHPNVQLKTKVSKNYRLPTLNDRYWMPGGNENLAAESGWSEEVTVFSNFKIKHTRFNISITAFNRNIDNWILWSLQEGQSFWSANNITAVWSRGLEPRLSYFFKKKNWNVTIKTGYDFIRSTNQVALTNPRIAKGAQLIYTPKHQAFVSCSIGWKSLNAIYQHRYTGTSKGINDVLTDYQVANLRLEYTKTFGQYGGSIFFNINNIWNTNYLVIERRPMPGSHYQIGFNFLFKKYKIQP